jgi:hypothetical protein
MMRYDNLNEFGLFGEEGLMEEELMRRILIKDGEFAEGETN